MSANDIAKNLRDKLAEADNLLGKQDPNKALVYYRIIVNVYEGLPPDCSREIKEIAASAFKGIQSAYEKLGLEEEAKRAFTRYQDLSELLK